MLLSIMCLLASRTQSNLGHWQAAYESLLFPVGVMLLDCAGCNKTYMLTLHPNAVFGTCVGQDVVELLRQSFSDEDQEALVPVDQLPPRVRSGVRERSLGVMSLDSALALMLQDERTTMGQRASSARMLSTTPGIGSEDVVRYPHLGHSQRLTGEVPVDETATVIAFMWLFALKSVLNNMHLSIADPKVHWKWYLFPAKGIDRQGQERWQEPLPVSIVSSASVASLVGGMLDVDLDAIARSSYAVQGSRDMIGTLQSMFQKPTRCEGLDAPVPPGSSASVVGLGKILCWGELPLIVRGDSVVLPFASAEDSASIVSWLDSGSGSFTWVFLRTHVSIGLFKVDLINNFSYVCSFQKRMIR